MGTPEENRRAAAAIGDPFARSTKKGQPAGRFTFARDSKVEGIGEDSISIPKDASPREIERALRAMDKRETAAEIAYMKQAANRRGTGHTHPPGPRPCPKCGV